MMILKAYKYMKHKPSIPRVMFLARGGSSSNEAPVQRGGCCSLNIPNSKHCARWGCRDSNKPAAIAACACAATKPEFVPWAGVAVRI